MDKDNPNTIKISRKQVLKYSTFLLLGAILFGSVVFSFAEKSPNVTGNVVALGGPGETVEIKTVIEGFNYSPDVITVRRGSKVRLIIENRDNVVHGLNLPQFGIVGSQSALGTKIVEFIAEETPTNGQAVPTCTQEHGETLTFNVV